MYSRKSGVKLLLMATATSREFSIRIYLLLQEDDEDKFLLAIDFSFFFILDLSRLFRFQKAF